MSEDETEERYDELVDTDEDLVDAHEVARPKKHYQRVYQRESDVRPQPKITEKFEEEKPLTEWEKIQKRMAALEAQSTN